MLINALSVIIGLLGTIALSQTMSFTGEKVAFGNSTTAFLLVLFAILILRHVYGQADYKDKRGVVLSGVYAFGLSFALTAGKQLHAVENFAVGNLMLWIQILLLTVFFFGPVLYVFQWLAQKGDKTLIVSHEQKQKSHEKTTEFLLAWLVIFLCWIPVFLAFYPGAFVYDAQDEYVQVATRTFSTHHPLSHVLMLGGFVCLGNKVFGSYNTGIAMYTLFQMVILSGIFAYTVSYLRTRLSKKICAGITLFYGLFPLIPMYAVCSAKDTLFNGAFLLMLVQMIKLLEHGAENKNKKDMLLFCLTSAGMMLLRNNGMMAYAAVLLLLTVYCLIIYVIGKSSTKTAQKEKRPQKDSNGSPNLKGLWRIGIMMVFALVLYSGVDKTLAVMLDADDSENQEILTVPIQQLARTYKYSPEVFSIEDRELLFSYIPEDILAIYDADLSDLVKAGFNNEKYSENPSEFVDLWFRTFLKKPVTYLNAWFMTSYGYWYPDTVINVYGGQQRFTFQYGDSSYFGFETELPGERDSKFPWLEEQYRKMSLELYQQNVPGISMLFSPGFLFWLFMGSLFACWHQKRYLWLLPMGTILLLWATVILGPTFLVRYVLILWFALPLIILAAMENRIYYIAN